MVAGKNVSASGCVILAHNEDDVTDVPTKSSYVPAQNGNNGYYWIEIAGLEVADSFFNDCHVGVVSNKCTSRDENMKEGGVLYEVRLTIAQKAKTAREAVEIAGRLVEEKGYRHNGRSYIIADENEAWVMSLVGGKNWIAQR
ncbi:MAG: C69 family dipeptidase, partial [Bacteroidales bacterium]|nr:C69 family dipeptidase [Bacteroidales bacterium]